uniref:Protein Wnt n=1 Tax=Dendrocoelum lacteum TaxID=27895 RepID=T1D114_9PLAT
MHYIWIFNQSFGMFIVLIIILTMNFRMCRSSKGLVFTMSQIHKIGYKDSDNQNQFTNQYLANTKICKKVLKKQRPLCKEHYPLMPSVISGFVLGISECQHQFSNDMWNCQGHNRTVNYRPLFEKSDETVTKFNKSSRRIKDTYLDRLIAKSTPESAYILAIISAGVSHQVTKACSQGIHNSCGCDRTVYDTPREGKFTWSGCSHNIHFGAAFARTFLDAREKKRSEKQPYTALTNMHNNHVGRQSIINKMKIKCKCHGVSGSCEIKTCSRNLPSFRLIGDFLKERFKNIIQVDYIDGKLAPKYPSKEMFGEVEMIYLNDSPDHCNHDFIKGTLGTTGRICNATFKNNEPEPINSCFKLCCQRGYHIKTYIRNENCRCKFKWCCKVICESCKRKVIDAICN